MAIIIETKLLKIREGHKSRGLAIAPFIFVTDKNDGALIAHEQEHIKQQIQGLWIGFFIKYAFYHLMFGYEKNPYEVAARKAADDWRQKQ